ncbi:hypothetical protein L1887_28335 [Cichorium endivia]|nr:hypothetical protein L1887_28335 [Cichorium endivia]
MEDDYSDEEEMDIYELEKRMWRDKILLRSLKEQNNFKKRLDRLYTRMATSKLKLFKMNSCSSRSIKSLNINRLLDSLCRSFSTLIESPKTDDPIEVTESPELPIWVRISENDTTIKKTHEDDFVLPSLSYWMENYKQGKSKGHDKITIYHVSRWISVNFKPN